MMEIVVKNSYITKEIIGNYYEWENYSDNLHCSDDMTPLSIEE
jgi:hypothetical protein